MAEVREESAIFAGAVAFAAAEIEQKRRGAAAMEEINEVAAAAAVAPAAAAVAAAATAAVAVAQVAGSKHEEVYIYFLI